MSLKSINERQLRMVALYGIPATMKRLLSAAEAAASTFPPDLLASAQQFDRSPETDHVSLGSQLDGLLPWIESIPEAYRIAQLDPVRTRETRAQQDALRHVALFASFLVTVRAREAALERLVAGQPG